MVRQRGRFTSAFAKGALPLRVWYRATALRAKMRCAKTREDMNLNGLAGKRAVVTGAASGIGAAIVVRLLSDGCRVLAVDINADALNEVWKDADAERLRTFAADVASDDGAARYVAAAVSWVGGVDLFANNAGIIRTGTIAEMAVADFDQVMAVNCRGVFLGLQAVLRQMQRQAQGGAIVNTASIGGLGSAMGCGAYNASKAGVITLSKVAAHENGRFGIRVNAICPGQTDTAMLAQLGTEAANERALKHPLGKVGQPSDVANLAVYLLGDESGFQTGGVYVVDGGAMVS